MVYQPNRLPNKINGDPKDLIFKASPGWGGRLRHFLKQSMDINLTIAILGITSFILSTVTVYTYYTENRFAALINNVGNLRGNSNDTAAKTIHAIVLTAQRGQGVSHLANNALHEYLAVNNDFVLDETERLFAINALSQTIGLDLLTEGQVVSFEYLDIEEIILHAKTLTPAQYAAWGRLLGS